jgi:hypothetical protein
LVQSGTYTATGTNDLELATNNGWSLTEFNIFGDSNASTAYFNDDPDMVAAKIQVRINVENGTANTPTCILNYTGIVTAEKNNLTLDTGPHTCNTDGSSIVFTEHGGGPSGFSHGDPHLMTFYGVHYNFQGSGDFILATNEKIITPNGEAKILIQARQKPVPGDSSVAFNTAVAAKMGRVSVAVCAPARIEVNGKPQVIPDGKSVAFPDAVLVSRKGDFYTIMGPGRQAIKAHIYGDHTDASFYLGSVDRESVRGLLGAAAGHPFNLAMRNGTVLPDTLRYKPDFMNYGESWRVGPNESLLCKAGAVAPGMPNKPVYGSDLPPAKYDHARNACMTAMVKAGPLLDDCILDVGVLGNSATDPFVSAPLPTKDIRPTFP